METLSRVKKYEDLRKQIEDDGLGMETLPDEKLQDYAQRLNEIDPTIFKKVALSEEEPYTPERERVVPKPDYKDETNTDEFHNEYLDDFINEVREYNIKKGTRENEDTQIDILNQLNAVSRAKRSDYLQNIEEVKPQPYVENKTAVSKEEIAEQVKNLIVEEQAKEEKQPVMEKESAPVVKQLKEPEATKAFIRPISEDRQKKQLEATAEMKQLAKQSEDDTMQMQKMKQEASLEQLAQEAIKPNKRHPFVNRKEKPTTVPTKEEQAETEREKRLQQKLVEETQQLRVQLNEYEDDLNDLSEGVEKTNKLLNIILGCLILALLVIIGIIVYWIVEAGGII
ncbi:MAG: hypothetical protein HFF02_05850 [Erysipelotrichaceae bacterium]|nr:hypothetical protein [Erysipelotrichaceae bacterium]